MVDKVALGQVFSQYFLSRTNSHSADCFTVTIIYHLGLVQLAKHWPQYQVDSILPHEKNDM
jgi:hypothetical protein